MTIAPIRCCRGMLRALGKPSVTTRAGPPRPKGVDRHLSAGDAYEAIRPLAEHQVDLIFTDIIMPSMDGVQLAKQARLMRPGIKVLFATGYAQKAMERGASRHGKVLFKPLREAEVIREVEAALAA